MKIAVKDGQVRAIWTYLLAVKSCRAMCRSDNQGVVFLYWYSVRSLVCSEHVERRENACEKIRDVCYVPHVKSMLIPCFDIIY